MRYDLTGRLTGIQLKGLDAVIEIPGESDEFLTSVRERGDNMEIRVDEESGEMESFEIS